jgi:hypothetical protein
MGEKTDLTLNFAYNGKISTFTEIYFLEKVLCVYFSAISSPVSFKDLELDVWLHTMNFLYVCFETLIGGSTKQCQIL